MARSFEFAVAQFRTHALRDERLNVALVVLASELRVYVPKSLDKLRAVSASLTIENVRQSAEQLPDLDRTIGTNVIESAQRRLAELSSVAPFAFSNVGCFHAENEEAYNRLVSQLVKQLIEPEPVAAKAPKIKATRLFADVKKAFALERVLARKGEGLEAHRIVTNHRLAEGLDADLVLRNGAMHIVQTVDASVDDSSITRARNEIAVSALIFEHSRMSYQEPTKARLIYRATSLNERHLSPSLQAAEHQGAELVNWESRDSRTRLIVELSSLADPLADIARERKVIGINASVQPRFKLN
jgi:hypothetical protein